MIGLFNGISFKLLVQALSLLRISIQHATLVEEIFFAVDTQFRDRCLFAFHGSLFVQAVHKRRVEDFVYLRARLVLLGLVILFSFVDHALLPLDVFKKVPCRLGEQPDVVWEHFGKLTIKVKKPCQPLGLLCVGVGSFEELIDVVEDKIVFKHRNRVHWFVVD